MSTVTVNRHIDLAALPFPASTRWDGTTCTVTADVAAAELRAAVDAAPDRTDLEPVDLAAEVAALRAEVRGIKAAAAAVVPTVSGGAKTVADAVSNAKPAKD